jgi:transposase
VDDRATSSARLRGRLRHLDHGAGADGRRFRYAVRGFDIVAMPFAMTSAFLLRSDLSEAQMRRLAPLLPADTHGTPQVDDQRVISGIVHVLRSGCPWRHAPREHGPPKTLDNRYVRFGDQGCVAAHLRGARGCSWPAFRRCCWMRPMRRRTAARRAGKGEARACHRALGGTYRGRPRWGPRRGGRTSKIDAAANQAGTPIAFHLSGANTLIEAVGEGALVIADRAFDADRFRPPIEACGAVPTIPPRASWRHTRCFSPTHYRSRNAIERMVCQLRDFRSVATQHDRLAAPDLAAIRNRRSPRSHIAATVASWW